MASPTASTAAPTRIESTTNVSPMQTPRDEHSSWNPSPEANRDRLAPKTATWNAIIVLTRLCEMAMAAMPSSSRAVPVANRIVWSPTMSLFPSEQVDDPDHRSREDHHQDQQVPG